jgi:hypothetical protein
LTGDAAAAPLKEMLTMNDGQRFRHTGALAASLALMTSAAALAGGHPDKPRLDTNGDGSVDLAEMQAARPDFTVEKFNKMDANGDGLLSREEMHAAHKGKRMAKIDADGDGNISLQEMQKRRPGMTQEEFSKLDADGNGTLSHGELKAAHVQHRSAREKKPADAG